MALMRRAILLRGSCDATSQAAPVRRSPASTNAQLLPRPFVRAPAAEHLHRPYWRYILARWAVPLAASCGQYLHGGGLVLPGVQVRAGRGYIVRREP